MEHFSEEHLASSLFASMANRQSPLGNSQDVAQSSSSQSNESSQEGLQQIPEPREFQPPRDITDIFVESFTHLLEKEFDVDTVALCLSPIATQHLAPGNWIPFLTHGESWSDVSIEAIFAIVSPPAKTHLILSLVWSNFVSRSLWSKSSIYKINFKEIPRCIVFNSAIRLVLGVAFMEGTCISGSQDFVPCQITSGLTSLQVTTKALETLSLPGPVHETVSRASEILRKQAYNPLLRAFHGDETKVLDILGATMSTKGLLLDARLRISARKQGLPFCTGANFSKFLEMECSVLEPTFDSKGQADSFHLGMMNELDLIAGKYAMKRFTTVLSLREALESWLREWAGLSNDTSEIFAFAGADIISKMNSSDVMGLHTVRVDLLVRLISTAIAGIGCLFRNSSKNSLTPTELADEMRRIFYLDAMETLQMDRLLGSNISFYAQKGAANAPTASEIKAHVDKTSVNAHTSNGGRNNSAGSGRGHNSPQKSFSGGRYGSGSGGAGGGGRSFRFPNVKRDRSEDAVEEVRQDRPAAPRQRMCVKNFAFQIGLEGETDCRKPNCPSHFTVPTSLNQGEKKKFKDNLASFMNDTEFRTRLFRRLDAY